MSNAQVSKELLILCQTALQNSVDVNSNDIHDLVVNKKANVCYKREDNDTPPLHALILLGNLLSIKECLESPEPIDFSVTEGQFRRTPFHLACDENLTETQTQEIMKLLSQRAQLHPEDVLNLWQTDTYGMHVLCFAASEQKLSIVWPHLKDFPCFSDPSAVSLNPTSLWKWDWNAMEECEREYFDIKDTILVDGSEATGKLFKECNKSNPKLVYLDHYIAQGADPLIQIPSYNGTMSMPLLYEVVFNGEERCCQSLLKCSRFINFNFQTNGGWTMFHCLCYSRRTCDSISKILNDIIDRLDRHPDELSLLNWSIKDDSGRDFISSAVQMGLLTCIWNVLMARKISFFLEQSTTFIITSTNISNCDKDLIRQHPKKFFFSNID